MCMPDAVNEEEVILCCAVCCANCSIYPACDACGVSGKVRDRSSERIGGWARSHRCSSLLVAYMCFCTFCFCLVEKAGICCCNLECCCKPGAPCLFPFCCLGIKSECDGCSVVNAQLQVCCLVVSAAVPCNEEVPLAVSVLGLTCYPTCGCCVQQKEIMNR
jgi:hypothetical protein